MISEDDVEVGDLVFATPGHDPLTRMISRYDHSPFSHVGIMVKPGLIASCRTETDMLEAGEVGGVKLDRFDFFQVNRHRDLYRARPRHADTAARKRAVAFACRFAEAGTAEKSSFSFAKMFQCAVAVEASSPTSAVAPEHRGELVDLAVRAARAWAWTEQRPSFFCAEFVVSAYGWAFRREDLAPAHPEVALAADAPGAEPLPAGATPPGPQHRLRLAENMLHYRPGPEQLWTMSQLVVATDLYSPGFLRETVTTLWSYLHPSHLGRLVAHHRTPGPFPHGLVTPRMVRDSTHVEEPELVAGGPSGG